MYKYILYIYIISLHYHETDLADALWVKTMAAACTITRFYASMIFSLKAHVLMCIPQN